MIHLIQVRNSHPSLRSIMPRHYSEPKGFVGRNICYLIFWIDAFGTSGPYGAIVGGSALAHIIGRDRMFPSTIDLNVIVNNTFFHIEPIRGKYPCRNFSTKVVAQFRNQIQRDWQEKYGDPVLGFETLVELPRTGELYLRDGWVEVGITKGYTCKRTAGKGTDSWSGKRVWNTTDLRPKRVLCRIAGER